MNEILICYRRSQTFEFRQNFQEYNNREIWNIILSCGLIYETWNSTYLQLFQVKILYCVLKELLFMFSLTKLASKPML